MNYFATLLRVTLCIIVYYMLMIYIENFSNYTSAVNVYLGKDSVVESN